MKEITALAVRVVWAITILFSITIPVAQSATEVPKYDVYEITLTTSVPYANPYTDVTLSATFRGPTKTINIEGFWDGGNTWKIRMAPIEIGTWTVVDVASNDSQLNNQKEGTTFTCRLPTNEDIAVNEALRHGFVQINPSFPRTFMHADGTPFFLMGDTAWPRAFLNGNIYSTGQFQQLVNKRSAQGFNVFTNAFAGAFNAAVAETGGNEGGIQSWTGDRPVPSFYQAADQRLAYMTKKGLVPMIMFGAPDEGTTTNLSLLERMQQYHIARWAAYNIIWLGVKEYEEWGSLSMSTIRAFGNITKQYDPYKHPSSTHTVDSTNELGGDSWLYFNGHQSRLLTLVMSDYNQFNKPIVVLEAYYEGPNYSSYWDFDDPQVLLEGLWGIQLHGGWNAGYELIPDSTHLDMAAYLNQMNNASANYHTYLKRFFEKTQFWKMVPNNGLVVSGTAWASAQLGKEYVLFLKNGGSVTVNLSSASGSLPIEWYNPRTGVFSSAGVTTGGANRSFTAPFSGSAVLHIGGVSSNESLAPAPPTSLTAHIDG